MLRSRIKLKGAISWIYHASFKSLSFSEPTGHPKEDNAHDILAVHHSVFSALVAVHGNIFPRNYIKNRNCSDFMICILSTALYEVRGEKKITKRTSIISPYVEINENPRAGVIFALLFLGDLTVSTTLISLYISRVLHKDNHSAPQVNTMLFFSFARTQGDSALVMAPLPAISFLHFAVD